MTLTIVSGAAPGVEQGAIEAAINLALTWRGRASGEHIAALPAIYRTGLQPTSAANPGMVRRINCQDADGALVFSTSMVLAGIPAFVDRVTEQMQRAFLHITLNPAALSPLPVGVRDHIRDWIRSNELGSVYVTGPSADDVPGIQGAVRDILIAILEPFAVDEIHETTRALGLIEQAQPGPPEPHPFVPGRFRQGDRGGQWPSETCDVCGTDPRNALHRAAAGPPEGIDDTQRARLDASIREAERDICAPAPSERTHWIHNPDIDVTACGKVGKRTTDLERVDCPECRSFELLYRPNHAALDTSHSGEDHPENRDDHEPLAPGDQTT